MASPPVVAPSREDPVVAGVSELIGGPVGRHASAGGGWWTPLRVLLALTALCCLLGFAQKAPCRTHPWADDYQYTRLCYSDVYALYFAEGLNTGATPYADHPVEYPVLIGGLMYVAARAVSGLPPAQRPAEFFDLTALLLAGAALVVTVTTVRLAGRRRPWDAAMVALAPTLVLHAYTNWDLAAVALVGLGLLAWQRGRPGWTGVWLGLGAATKLYPVLLLVPLFLLCLRARRLPAFRRTVLAGVVSWVVVDVPVWVAYPASFGRFWTLNRSRGADWDSVWFLLQQGLRNLDTGFHSLPVPLLNLLVAAAFTAALAGIAWLALRAPVPPRLASLGFLTVAAFLLTNKVYSPQYVLWLVPLAALARPRWPAFLAWQASEVLLLLLRYPMFIGQGQPGHGVPLSWFLTSVAVRDLALAALAGLVVRDILRPEYDVVRRGGDPDPAGGVLVSGARG